MKIPMMYRLAHAALLENAKGGKMTAWEFRRVVGRTMNIRSRDAMALLFEMKEMKLVGYDPSSMVVRVL